MCVFKYVMADEVFETDHASDDDGFDAAPATVARARPCVGDAVPPLLLSVKINKLEYGPHFKNTYKFECLQEHNKN